MQLTIDSSEPLTEVVAVVGALYGVQLVVSDGSAPVAAAPSSSRRRSGRSSGRSSSRGSSRGASSASAATRSSRRSRQGAGEVDAKVVRQWAVDQGMSVSSRGQLSKAILEAYAANA